MQVHIGCSFVYESRERTPMAFIVRPCAFDRHQLGEELRLITPDVPIEEYSDPLGNRVWRLVAPAGVLRLHYDALAEVPATPDLSFPDLPATPVEQLPYDLAIYTLPSRYCESDLFADDAWALFGALPSGWPRVQAICDWVTRHMTYGAGSTARTSGRQAYDQARGVCRDYAHIAISFCRALNIPARYVSGYLPDDPAQPNPAPMDFHAWFEAYLSGAWYTFDARHSTPQVGRVVIGRGRDAADVAFTTIYGGSQLLSMSVWAAEISDPSAIVARLRGTYAGVTQLRDDQAPPS